jgi:hypothetical protein
MVMRRMSVQGLTALILVGTLTISQAAGPAIGVAMANGSFQVDNSQVYGNTTLFDGASIQTDKSPSRLKLNNGAKMGLGENSKATVSNKRMTLERGTGEVRASSTYWLDARTLQISPADSKATARVKLQGEKQVLVAAVDGRVRVFNESGLLVANMERGVALLFTPQAAQPSTFQMTGCLVQSQDGKFFLVDPNQTVELRGDDLAKEANNRVEVSGTAFRSAAATPPASQVVQVGALKRTEEGGCADAIAAVKNAGVKVVETGNVATPPKVATGTSHTGIYVGVAVAGAAAAGIGIALGSGKKSTSP